jgi:hypothetical protein
MGGACRTYEEIENYTGFWCVNLRERDHSEEIGVNVRRTSSSSGNWMGNEW